MPCTGRCGPCCGLRSGPKFHLEHRLSSFCSISLTSPLFCSHIFTHISGPDPRTHMSPLSLKLPVNLIQARSRTRKQCELLLCSPSSIHESSLSDNTGVNGHERVISCDGSYGCTLFPYGQHIASAISRTEPLPFNLFIPLPPHITSHGVTL